MRQRLAYHALLACLLASTVIGTVVAADDASPKAADGGLRFRRIFVPADRPAQWPPSKEPYLPIEAEQFERQLDAAQATGAGNPQNEAPRLTEARYAMRLVGDDLLVGDVHYEVVHLGRVPALLALTPCNLAMESATWASPASTAVLGTNPRGELVALVERSGQMHCEVALRGEHTAGTAMSFRVQLPGCPVNLLEVELPSQLEVSADQGILRPTSGAKQGVRRWLIELGGHHQVTLRVSGNDDSNQRRRLALLRQSSTYEILPRGVNLVAQLRLEVHNEPLSRIQLRLDPRLRLLSAKSGEWEIPFSIEAHGEGQEANVTLELPEPILGTGRVILLSAIAPAPGNELWTVPAIRPQGMLWQEGTATLLVPAPLVLQRMVADGCRQSKTSALAAPLVGESIEAQYFRPDGTLKVLVGRPRFPLTMKTGTIVDFGAAEIQSQAMVAFEVREGEHFALRGTVSPEWVIDDVKARGAAQLADWSFSQDTRKLTIQLATAVSPSRSVRLLINAHRLGAVGTTFDTRQLTMVDFDDAVALQRRVALRTAEGYELLLNRTDGVRQIDMQALAPADLKLFAEAPGPVVYEIDESADRLTASIAPRRPGYTAEVRIDAVVHGDALTETYSVRCIPEAARVERLLVALSRADKTPLRWSLAGGASGQVTAKRLDAQDAPTGLAANGELWEVNLKLPRNGPFELRAVRATPFVPDQPIALAALPEATTQSGTVVVRSLGQTGLTIRNLRLKPVPPESVEADRLQTARGTYRYEPARHVIGSEPAILLSPTKHLDEVTGAWVWKATLISRYSARGTVSHIASYRIQSAGRPRVHFKMPAGSTMRAAWVDRSALSRSTVNAIGEEFYVELPPGIAFATVALSFETRESLPSLTKVFEAALPEIGLPVMAREWTICLPPAYDIANADNEPALTWSQRLFGPFGRRATAGMFLPWQSGSWQVLTGQTDNREAARKLTQRFIESLGEQVRDLEVLANDDAPSFGEILQRLDDGSQGTQDSLLIDVGGLEQLGVGPWSRVERVSDTSARAAGLRFLHTFDLVALSDGTSVLLTSNNAAQQRQQQWESVDVGRLGWIRGGAWSDELKCARRDILANRYFSVAQWNANPATSRWPWGTEVDGDSASADQHAWNTYTIEGRGASLPSVRIVRNSAMRALGIAVFLAVVGWGWRFGPERRRLWVVVTCVLAALALLVPSSCATIASAALLGALVCLIVLLGSWIAPAQVPSVEDSSYRTRSRVAGVATLLLIACGGMLLWTRSAGAGDVAPAVVPGSSPPKLEPITPATKSRVSGEALAQTKTPIESRKPANASPPDEQVHTVLIPMGDERRTVGSKYHISESFFRELHRRAARAAQLPDGWLITRATYRATLTRDPAAGTIGVSEFKAQFDIRTFAPETPVRLPLARKHVRLVEGGARLDGRPVVATWAPTGDDLVVNVPESGEYRLEVTLQPEIQRVGSYAGIDLRVPPVTNAVLHVVTPTDAPSMEFPFVRGKVATSDNRGETHAQLGPSDRLVLRWPEFNGKEGGAAKVEVDELLWVKVQPGSMTVDAKFKIRVLEGRIRQLRLRADSGLRVLPTQPPDSIVEAVHPVTGAPEMLSVDLARVVSGQATIDVKFLVTETSGVGNLRLPRLEVAGAAVGQRWLGVSIDAALESQEHRDAELRPIAVPEFATAWESGDNRPDFAYSIPRGELTWVLSTRPREPRILTNQVHSLTIGRGVTRLDLQALLTPTSGFSFQCQLATPAGFDVDSVSVVEDGLEHVARWSHESSRLTLFLTGPIGAPHLLHVRGHLPTPETGVIAAPMLNIEGAEVLSDQLRLLRQPTMLVELEQAGLRVIEAPASTEATSGSARLIGAFHIKNPGIPPRLILSVNHAEATAIQTTLIRREADAWVAEIDHQLQVTQGLIDAVRFEIPGQWLEPLEFDPPANHRFESLPGETRRHLVVELPTPARDRFRLKMRGRVDLSSGDRLRVPEIIPQGMKNVQRYVALPTRIEGRQVAWETYGLQEAAVPRELTGEIAANDFLTYQVVGDRFQATFGSVERVRGLARVLLADVRLAWQEDGACQGSATFDLDPAGRPDCTLRVPSDFRPVHFSVDGQPALATPLGRNRWRIELGPSQLTQRLEVVYAGMLPRNWWQWNVREFNAPSLEEMSVHQTLWSIVSPASAGIPSPSDPQWHTNAMRQDLIRLETAVSALGLATDVAAEYAPEELVRWSRPWQKRLEIFRAAVHSHARFDTLGGRVEEEAQLQTIEADVARLTPQFRAEDPDAFSLVTFEAGNLLMAGQSRREPTLCLVRGDSPLLSLSYTNAAGGSLVNRVFVACLILVSALVLLLLSRLVGIGTVPWPLLIALIGVAWWLWLSPSIAGLALAVVGLIAWARHLSRPTTAGA